jgi:S-methylmethionine-dependent homocysteine/selenocysteine methylase
MVDGVQQLRAFLLACLGFVGHPSVINKQTHARWGIGMKIYSNVKGENVDKLARELMEEKKEKVRE